MYLDIGPYLIRPWKEEDLASLVRHANDREIWRNMRDRFPHPYTKRHAEQWIEHVGEQLPTTDFAIVANGTAIGGIGLIPQGDVNRVAAEVGYWLGRSYWGRGIATAALREFTDRAFREFELTRIFAAVFAHNRASMRVLEKAGFTRECVMRAAAIKEGRVLDEVLFGRVAPALPRGYEAFRE